MKTIKEALPRAGVFFLILTLLCGGVYTLAVTGAAQLIFPKQANGSIIEVDGKKYGCELLAQSFSDEGHMWGRVMSLDLSTFKDENGKRLMYSAPSNLSPSGEEFKALVAQRVSMMKAANPEMKEEAIPVDLVTNSGSGLDPHISKAAAEYQIPRICAARGISEAQLEKIIEKCTDKKLFGVLGEEVVNVLEVNLSLEGILK
ncbi:MAG: potassium-transporting ATPase subunit KdpC [Oscillospiraceae bacterium]